jgi:hypothetical protein
MNKFNILAGLVGILTVFTGYLFLSNQISNVVNIGTELPDAPALFETSLAAPITATADSFTLTANSVRGGGSLSGYNCFTIDEGSAQAEFVCGTASSTSVTGVTRGISPSDGTSAVTALQFAHRRGASVKITDFPIIQILRNQNNGEATFENVLRYAGGVVPTGASDLADVGYVLSVVNGGTVTFDALVVAGTAGETLATSTLVYFKSSDQRWWKVDTDDTATFTGVALGLTRGTGTAGNSIVGGGVLLKGLQTGLSALTAGSTYYASTTGGGLGTATTVLPVGVAKSTTELYFDPVMIGVPRLAMNNTFTGSNTFATTTISNLVVTDITGAVSKLVASSSQQTLSGSTTESVIFSVNVPSGALSTDNAIRFKVYIQDQDDTAGGQVLTYRFKYGSTTIATSSISGAGVTNQNGVIEGYLYANNSVSSQFGLMKVFISENKTTISDYGGDVSTVFAQELDTGSASENSATDKTLSLTVQQTSGANLATLTIAGYVIELIQ